MHTHTQWNSVFVSSNVNEVIRAISNFFIFFFYEKTLSEQKAQKRKQAAFFPIDVFMLMKMLLFLFLFACLRFCAFCTLRSLEIFS